MIWISSVPYSRDDFDSNKPPAKSDVTGSNFTGYMNLDGTIDVPTTLNGKPPIIKIIDYWLRNENGEAILDSNGEGISLEGLVY